MTEETQQMEVVPLLPCPFCGKEARYVPADYIDGMGEPWPFAECDPCNVGAPVEFWNKRADKGQGEPATYSSTQATNCAGCGKYKHTPLRVDGMGGYVCLTCIDERLEELLDAEQPAPVAVTLPKRIEADDLNEIAQGWNCCLDAVERLNP